MTTSPCVLPVPLRPHSKGLGITADHLKKISRTPLGLPNYRPINNSAYLLKGLKVLDDRIRTSHRGSVHSAPCLKIKLKGFGLKMADVHFFPFFKSLNL